MAVDLRSGDQLDLRPDRAADGGHWLLKRHHDVLARLVLRGTWSPLVRIAERELTLDPCDSRSLVLWEPATETVECWVTLARRPGRCRGIFPQDNEPELRLARKPFRGPRLTAPGGRRLATFQTTRLRGDPLVHVDVDEVAEPSPAHGAAILSVTSLLLLDALGMQPVEDRARDDIGWEFRAEGGMLGGVFGGGDVGGGAGGGGDGGGGGGGGGT